MTDHRFPTPERNVQQSASANGVMVTVNFSLEAYRLADGTAIQPMGYHVSGFKPGGV